jgi:radical SAM protein with 4Fe4S-binding SPASM domain
MWIRVLQILSSYLLRKEELNYKPYRLWVEPTSVCNLRCVMCPQSLSIPKKHGYMRMELFKKIIDEAKDFVHDINIHHTGEATLHPKLSEMIKYAEDNGVYTKLHTNATLLDEELSVKLIESKLSLLSFSFDGFDAETYEKIRRYSNFNKTLRNIINFLEIKKRIGSKKPYTILEVIKLSNKLSEDADNYRDFMKRFEGLPLDRLRIKEPHNWAGKYDVGKVNENYTACTFLWYAMVINWNGKVTPCPQDYYCDLILGDVNEQSLWGVWNGEAMRLLRRKMRSKDVVALKPCDGCDLLRRRSILRIPLGNVKEFITGKNG